MTDTEALNDDDYRDALTVFALDHGLKPGDTISTADGCLFRLVSIGTREGGSVFEPVPADGSEIR